MQCESRTGQTFDGQQQLVLLRFYARLARGIFTET
jgi:hypothetical protein